MLLGIALTVFILRSILVPLRSLVGAVRAISRGDATVDLPPPSHDEIGEMTRALHLFRESLVERDRLERAAEHQRRTIQQASRPERGLRAVWTGRTAACCAIRNITRSMAGSPTLPCRVSAFRRYPAGSGRAASIIELGGLSAEAWIEMRMRNRAEPRGVHEFRVGRRWVQVAERKTYDGGTVAVHTDITELKERQARIAAVRRKAPNSRRR